MPKEKLTKEDYQHLIKFLEAMAARGSIKGAELPMAGYLYQKIKELSK